MSIEGFTPGDRVTRPINIFAAASDLRHGTVVRRYQEPTYPELYEVRWDGSLSLDPGYFRHGLDPEESSP